MTAIKTSISEHERKTQASSNANAGVELLDVDQLLSSNLEDITSEVAQPAPQPQKPGKAAAAARSRKPGKTKDVAKKRACTTECSDLKESMPQTRSKVINEHGAKDHAAILRELNSDDEAEQDPLRDTVSGHKADLEALRQQDPQFYEYLKEADSDLLAFGDGMDLSSSDEEALEAPQAQDEDSKPGKKKKGKALPAVDESSQSLQGGLRVTEDVAAKCCDAAKTNASMGSVHQLMRLYRAACHYSDSEQQTEISLQITSSRAFNKIMLFTLAEADGLLRRMLGNTEATADKEMDVTRQPRWRKVEALAKSFLGNTLHMLGSMTNAGMQAFVLRRLRSSVVFLRPFEKITRKLLKAAMGLFGMAGDRSVNMQAILFIRQVALVLPQPALENCLKGVTRTFSAYAKFSNATSAAHLGFMATCIVELFSMDEAASYSHAFNGIKDLAVTLRGALTNKSADSFRAVYCWQTVRCLELWARVITDLGPQSELRALVYPLVQILLGSARLVPAPRYFPLRLRIAAALHRVAESAGVLVPLAPLLLEMLTWSDLAKPPQIASGQAPDLQTALRVSKAALRTASFQEDVVSQVLQLLTAHLAQWSTSVAAPEVAHLPTLHLKALAKSLPAERFRSQVKALLAAIERNSVWVGRRRDTVDFSPKDLSSCQAFLSKERAARQAPLQVYSDLLTKRLQTDREMRSAERVALPSPGGRKQRAEAVSSDDDEPVQSRQASQKQPGQQRQPAKPSSTASGQGEAFSLAEEADTELLADYQLSEDDEDNSRPADHAVFTSAGPTESESDHDNDYVMGGDFESDPEDEAGGPSPSEKQHKAAAGSSAKPRGTASRGPLNTKGGVRKRTSGSKGKSKAKQRKVQRGKKM